MDIFPVVEKIEIESGSDFGARLFVKIQPLDNDIATFLLERCGESLNSALQPLFPDKNFYFDRQKDEPELLYTIGEDWSRPDEDILGHFLSALTRRYPQIRTSWKREPFDESVPWFI